MQQRHALDEMNMSDEEREAYEDRLKWLRVEVNTVLKAKREAEAKGKIEGERIGIEKGIEKVATNMLRKKCLFLTLHQ